ncbi:hypothetical protein M404DRAFT_534504 [Pisolithus tinctorius Marx 270]|uniref:Uncharacterized protein n=1 Tax=Pisolithus tinctorius Marx 270 TaxID=870435 RepID=A0A0C3PBT5_PISTI|nr:hypothetical protein M404DRAFT_534504 [Pisolithus tinctorius Marx 270]
MRSRIVRLCEDTEGKVALGSARRLFDLGICILLYLPRGLWTPPSRLQYAHPQDQSIVQSLD